MRNVESRRGLGDDVWTRAARRIRARDDELTNEWLYCREKDSYVFVGAHADDRGRRNREHRIVPRLNQGGSGCRCVCTVEDNISIVDGQSLEASGPACAGQSGADGRLCDVNAGRVDHVERGKRGARVLNLMGAGDSERELWQSSPWPCRLERAPGAIPSPVLA